jgi:hypothetical protein
MREAADRRAPAGAAMARVAVTQDRQDIGWSNGHALGHLDLEGLVRGRLVAVTPIQAFTEAASGHRLTVDSA